MFVGVRAKIGQILVQRQNRTPNCRRKCQTLAIFWRKNDVSSLALIKFARKNHQNLTLSPKRYWRLTKVSVGDT